MHSQAVHYREFTTYPLGSTAPFHIWKYHGFAKNYTWEDETPELMMFSPLLIVAWSESCKSVRYEFAMAMQSAKSRSGNVWFRKIRDPQSILGPTDSPLVKFVSCWHEELLQNGHAGGLPICSAPRTACEHAGTIIDAGRTLQTCNYDYLFMLGEEDSTFQIFATKHDALGDPIVQDRFIVQDKLESLLCPQKNKKNKQKRNISLKLRRSILERDGYQCVDCGRSPQKDPKCILHVDHRVAVAKGGSSRSGNLQTLCDWCNLGKGTDTDWKLGKKR
jgi:hypothetical protein